MKRIKPLFFTLGVMILATLACLSSGPEQSSNENIEDISTVGLSDVPLGKWNMTKLSGSITDERTGGGLDMICDYYNNTYQAIMDSEDTYVEVLMSAGPPNISKLPEGLFETDNLDGLEGVFSFKFAFDNGYYTNNTVTAGPTTLVYFAFMPEVWTLDLGYWADEGLIAANRNGSPGGGFSHFVIQGTFDGPKIISGSWSFQETTSLPKGVAPECASTARGSGDWAAEAP